MNTWAWQSAWWESAERESEEGDGESEGGAAEDEQGEGVSTSGTKLSVNQKLLWRAERLKSHTHTQNNSQQCFVLALKNFHPKSDPSDTLDSLTWWIIHNIKLWHLGDGEWRPVSLSLIAHLICLVGVALWCYYDDVMHHMKLSKNKSQARTGLLLVESQFKSVSAKLNVEGQSQAKTFRPASLDKYILKSRPIFCDVTGQIEPSRVRTGDGSGEKCVSRFLLCFSVALTCTNTANAPS